MTIEILSPEGDPIIVAPPIYRTNSFEHVLSYQRVNNEHVEFVVSHIPVGEKPVSPQLSLASYRTTNNPNMIPSALLELSIEEARLLRDFLTRPEVSAYLEEDNV